jgi:parallel beta-helix repeat protein
MRPSPAVRLSLLVLTSLFAVALTSATTINVPGDYSTIQAAINAASTGDTILVAAGTYTENIDFKGKAITLKSVSGAASTIIDGGALDTVVKFQTSETSSSVLNGFTIRNGAANSGSVFSGSGILVSSSSPTITNNIVTSNTACEGAGINVQFGSPLIQDNTISNNAQAGCSGGTGGGGILLGGAAQPQIIGNTISSNSTGSDGGGISLFAAGNPVIRGNTISGNSSLGNGGGIAMGNQSDAIVTDNLIISNSALHGGGVATLVPSGANGPIFVNNTFANNSGPQGGAQLYFSGFPNHTQFSNNLFYGGTATIAAVDCDNTYSSQAPIFTFNDTFNPLGSAYTGSCSSETGSNSNVSTDPLFVNSTSDFHLQSSSPAIDGGSNSAPNIPQLDVASNDRILDGNGDCVATVDLGAYEFSRTSTFTLNPTTLTFPDQVVGNASSPLSSAVTNNSANSTTICMITLAGDFAQTNTCGSALPSKGSCTVNVTFTPTAHGARSGTLQIVTNDAATGQTIALSGNGVLPAVSFSPTSLNFAAQLLGTTSSSQTLTLNNSGDGPLSISNVSISGDFSQSNTCGNTVAVGASCTFTVSFTPTATGRRLGPLTITDNASGSPHSILLTGTGNDFSLGVASGGSASASVTAGSAASYDLQLSPLNGFSSAVTLSCSGAPSLSSCNVSPTSITPAGAAAPFSVSVSTTAPSLAPPLSPLRFPPLRIVPLALFACTALLLPLLFRCCAQQRGRPRLALLPVLALLLLGVISVASCGGGSSSVPHNPGTPQGTYTLTVTGTAGGQARTVTLTLNVN